RPAAWSAPAARPDPDRRTLPGRQYHRPRPVPAPDPDTAPTSATAARLRAGGYPRGCRYGCPSSRSVHAAGPASVPEHGCTDRYHSPRSRPPAEDAPAGVLPARAPPHGGAVTEVEIAAAPPPQRGTCRQRW